MLSLPHRYTEIADRKAVAGRDQPQPPAVRPQPQQRLLRRLRTGYRNVRIFFQQLRNVQQMVKMSVRQQDMVKAGKVAQLHRRQPFVHTDKRIRQQPRAAAFNAERRGPVPCDLHSGVSLFRFSSL